MVSALGRCSREVAGYPRVVLFSPASVEATTDFLATRWQDACAIADPDRHFHAAFARAQARIGQILSLRVLCATLRALWRGHLIGRVVGDARRMPGILVVRQARILWDHPFAHVGDHPDFAAIPALAGVASQPRTD